MRIINSIFIAKILSNRMYFMDGISIAIIRKARKIKASTRSKVDPISTPIGRDKIGSRVEFGKCSVNDFRYDQQKKSGNEVVKRKI
jgi:hypothetical protein